MTAAIPVGRESCKELPGRRSDQLGCAVAIAKVEEENEGDLRPESGDNP